MTPERWQKVEAVLQSALDRDESHRPAFLDEACGGDPDLRREVESLLAMQGSVVNFIEVPALEGAEGFLRDEPADSMVERYIGPYQIRHEIGHGGMGAVYLAFRADDEYQKQVAIKLVKRGMDSEAILRRFRNERQILADLDHPNIARLIDGGTTEDGLPYFIMDHVEGLPIDVYCDAHKLSIVERLKLFRTVCSAVQYAHQHHVIHRDLKPGNIFVTAEGVPKLLDFGIAKVLNPEPPFQTVESTGLRPMTPDYASPEQVRGETITPASDVYSLGVLLYELLTGHRPYRVKGRTPQEIERVICEEEPEKPSAAIGRIEEVPRPDGTTPITLMPESVSATRDGQPEQLRRRLVGDLDNIVLMALRKEPERRYPSVEQFSEDIHRYREGLAVLARKDALWYRSVKFIKRNKASVISAGLSAMILIFMGVGIYLFTARSQIDSLAVLPFVNASADPSMEYLSDGITETLMNQLSQLPNLKVLPRTSVFRYKGKEQDPHAVGKSLNVQAVLTGKVVQTDDNLTISAELVDVRNNRHLWGDKYTRKLSEILVLQEEITRQISDHLRTRLTGAERELLAKRDTENPAAYREYLLGRHFWSQRTRTGLKRALQHFERAIELDPNYALAHAGVADSYIAFATFRVLSPKEAYPKTRAAAIRALELNPALSEAHSALAVVSLYHDWDWAAAERAFQRALALKPDDATARLRYALALPWFERFDEALHEIGQARAVDPVSPLLGVNTGQILYFARRYDQSIEELRKTLALDPNFWAIHNQLGLVHVVVGAHDEAIVEFKKAFDLGKISEAEANLAHAYAVSGQVSEAKRILTGLINRSKQTYVSPFDLAVVYAGLGDREQAFAWLEKAYEERSRPMLGLKVNPRLDPLRSDPRFSVLMRRVGFPP